jgi:hypothetical protein
MRPLTCARTNDRPNPAIAGEALEPTDAKPKAASRCRRSSSELIPGVTGGPDVVDSGRASNTRASRLGREACLHPVVLLPWARLCPRRRELWALRSGEGACRINKYLGLLFRGAAAPGRCPRVRLSIPNSLASCILRACSAWLRPPAMSLPEVQPT